jgi:hypothetical protein
VIYVSTACYSLGRELGHDDAIEEFRRQVLRDLNDESLAAAKTIARLRNLEEIVLHIDAGATSIGRTRSRALFEAWRHPSNPDVWVMCDDDVEADKQTLAWLVEAARKTRGVVLAPCWLRRREPVVNVILTEAGIVLPLSDGGAIMPCAAGGLGLAAMHRDAIDRVWSARMPELAFLDEDGSEKCGCFVEVLSGGKWWTEDLSFFIRWLPDDVARHCLLSGRTCHDHRLLDCSSVPQLPRMAYDDAPRVTL